VDRHVSIDDLPSPRGPRALGESYELKRLRSDSSSFPLSSTASSDAEGSSSRLKRPADLDATPRAANRTRAKKSEVTLLRTVHRRPNGMRVRGKGKENLLRPRSKSFGADKEERKARFGDEVKSPGKALIG